MKSKRLSLKWEVETFKDAGLKIVGPDDFLRKSCQVYQEEMTSSPQLIPYCLDFSSQESIYCLGLDPKYAQQAVFHYEYLREHVKKIVTIITEKKGGEGCFREFVEHIFDYNYIFKSK